MERLFYPLAIAALLGFFAILVNYPEKAIVQIDQQAAELLGGRRLLDSMSFIGDPWMIAAVSLTLLVYLWLFRKNYRGMLFVLLAVGVGNVLNQSMKEWFERPRPELQYGLEPFSFPANHAMVGLLYLFTLAYFLSEGTVSRKTKILIWLTAVGLSMTVALSRVAGGEHYFSDIVAGLFVGYAWFVAVAVWYELRERLFRKRDENRKKEEFPD
ncbi:phosphatidylglycerophosphatase B [Planococcus antarcticus DSM 14505]|uniref:Phosphatidylglycerophosphatase B n=1 Tax=Planococcus antarcticus DSM 14505 TaxID=1185653 RepID=A0AA87IKL5_9BACL|nr:phosphatase PAP2 family protein [Planococcus antarcticus]EIM06545.1 phosphatidylglycerophosphatase B [Planococcus antarcticus DSM 14505]